MPIAVDGSNLLHYLNVDRTQVRRLSLELARREGIRLTVVFDGPPPSGSPARELLGSVTVIWSQRRSADDTIVDALPTGAQARNWTVVTDDRELRRRVQARGGRIRSLSEWAAKLKGAATTPSTTRDRALSDAEVAEWEAFFADQRDGAT